MSCEAATGGPFTWKRIADWWYGGRVEQAWSRLHEAELLIIDASTTDLIPVLLEEAVEHAAVLDQTDPARARLSSFVECPQLLSSGYPMTPSAPAPSTPPPVPTTTPPRVMMRAVAERAFAVSDGFHQSARAFRNRLVVTFLIIVGVAAGLVILQWRLPQAPIFAVPHNPGDLSRWAVMLLVMVFGGLGALVTTIPSMAAIPTVTSPFNFPMQQAFVKISLGTLTAILGVIAIGNAGVTNGFDSLQSLIGVGVIFGAGQQAVTQFLDKRASEIIASAPSS